MISSCRKKGVFFPLCLNARQPGKVLNGLNAGPAVRTFHRISTERLF